MTRLEPARTSHSLDRRSVHYDPFMTTAKSEPETSSRRGWWGSCGDWVAAAWIVAYALYFFHFTLPNNAPLSRVDVWWELPDLLWANIVTPPTFPPSSWWNLSQRLDLFAVAAAIWLGSWGVGGLVLRVFRVPVAAGSAERCVCACGVGLSVVSLLTLGCGLVGGLSPWLLGGLLAVAAMAEGWLWIRERFEARSRASAVRGQESKVSDTGLSAWQMLVGVLTRGEQIPYAWIGKSAAVIAIGVFLLAMLLGSVLPPTDFDVKAYHLTGPKEYFLNGRITFLEHNVYTNFPFLTEMLCLLGMVLRQDWYRGALAGQAVLMGFAPLTGLALFCAGRRWFRESVGWLAAVIYLTTPWTYRLAIIAYVEGALSCYLFLALFAVLSGIESWRCDVDGHRSALRWILLAGLFAGSAMACKYPGLVSVVLPLGLTCGVAAWRSKVSGQRSAVRDQKSDGCRQWAEGHGPSAAQRVISVVLAFGMGVLLTIGPWLLKNLVMTGNPVYPLAYGLFGGRDWDGASHAKWRAGHSPATFALSDLVEKFIDVTAKADWLSPLLFGLAPLALIGVRSAKCQVASRNTALALSTRHLAVTLWLYVAYLFAQWWLLTHRIDRFWVPMIPVVALLAAQGAEWSPGRLWRRLCGVFVALSVLFNLGFITTALCGNNSYLRDLEEARRGTATLPGAENTAEAIHYLNELVRSGRIPETATVLCVGEAQVFDALPRVIYHTVFDQPIFRDWLAQRPAGAVSERDWPLRPIAEIRRRFAEAGVTHVLVNWQEILRYRRTYGYSDFVAPQRFAWLHERGLLTEAAESSVGLRDFDSLSPDERREVEEWAPALKRPVGAKTQFIAWQLFAVRP